MKEFDENSYCEKCGCDDIAVRYVAKDGYSITDGDHLSDEHMRRTCRRCGYKWNEAPLNYAKDEE